jgi:pyroglutamyl-peptidase
MNARQRHRRVMITGFEPFPTQPVNATAVLVPTVAALARRLFPDVTIDAHVLPTEWQRGPWALEDAVLAATPDVVLSFGIAGRAKGFEIETRARNVMSDKPDAAGLDGSGNWIDRDAPERLDASLPVSDIVRRLRARGIPVIPSRSAGTYICNATLFHALRLTRQFPRMTQVGFIHLPAELPVPGRRQTEVNRSSPLTWNQAVIGAVEIVASCLDRLIAPQALARALTQPARQRFLA